MILYILQSMQRHQYIANHISSDQEVQDEIVAAPPATDRCHDPDAKRKYLNVAILCLRKVVLSQFVLV